MNSLEKEIEVATEILAIRFSKYMFDRKQVELMLKEKELVSLGDKEIIEKVINVYGNELKGEIRNGQ